MGIRTVVKNTIYEESTWELDFDVFEKDGTTAVTPSTVKIYLYLADSENSPTYINGRDGTDSTGVSNNANAISIHLSPDDNQIIGTADFDDVRHEKHTLLVEVLYNADADRDFFEFALTVKNIRPVT